MEVFAGLDPVMLPVVWISVFIFCVTVNFAGTRSAEYFGTMVFFDAIGTAIAAFTCGPWMGAIVGFATNMMTGALLFKGYALFFYVNMFCGIAWGFMAKHCMPTSSDISIILYILTVGGIVGALSGLLATPCRILLGYKTDHLLDRFACQCAAHRRMGQNRRI